MKKIILLPFLTFLFFLSFSLIDVNKVKADICRVNDVDYQIPATIAFRKVYTILEHDDGPKHISIPSSYSNAITLYNIESEESCLGISNYPYQVTSTYQAKLQRTSFAYYNIILDTISDSSWSYSGTWPIFYSTPKQYSISFVSTKEDIEGSFYASVDEKVSLDTILSYITSFDDYDNDITSTITVEEDNYSSNYNVLGSYLVSFKSVDSSSNTSYLNVYVNVVDATKPVISGPSLLDSYMSNPLSIAQIKENLTVYDNYDTNMSFSLLEDNYSLNSQKIGVFNISFFASDSSDNSTTYIVSINVIDDIAPTIEGIEHIIKGTSVPLDMSFIRSLIKATDNIDLDVTDSILIKEDTYSLNMMKVGTYSLIFVASDKSNNESSPYTITIDIYDAVPPVFYVNENVIITDPNRIVTKEEIINLLIATKQLTEDQINSLSLIKDNYTTNSSKEGIYTVTYSFETENGLETFSFDINVTKESKEKKSNKSLVLALSSIALLTTLYLVKRKIINPLIQK